MDKKHSYDHKDGVKTSARTLCCSVPCDTIRVDLFAMHDKIYGTGVHGSGKIMLETFFTSLFLEY